MINSKYLKLFIVFFIILVFNVNADTSYENATFVRCVDGDTAVFKVNDEDIKFRFLAIDTPETVHPTKEVQEFGKDASEYTCNRLTNASSIFLEYENSNKSDKYGRKLAWIWIDGSLLQEELINAGYASVAYIYGKYKYTDSLCLVQSKAREKKNGIWNDETREIGYCQKVDISKVENNISFGSNETNINLVNETETNEDSQYDKYSIYIIIIIMVVSFILKNKKK